MQLNTTIIRHKRFSTYGWNLIENGVYKNILNQGEIGVLLGHKYIDQNNVEKVELITSKDQLNAFADDISQLLNSVLEVRVGTQDNQYFFDALIIGTYDQADLSIRPYATRLDFPTIGKENQLYIAKDTNIIWRWDDNKLDYLECSQSKQDENTDWRNIQLIDGNSMSLLSY